MSGNRAGSGREEGTEGAGAPAVAARGERAACNDQGADRRMSRPESSPIISLIVALSKNRAIGVENRLPWHLPEDLKRFRALTRGHPVIMGRKTFESIGRLLPERQNVIVTRQADYRVAGADVVHSLEEALRLARADSGEIFVIGGGEIYRQALQMADRIYLTWVDVDVEGDAFFPEWNTQDFVTVANEVHPGYRFETLERIAGQEELAP